MVCPTASGYYYVLEGPEEASGLLEAFSENGQCCRGS